MKLKQLINGGALAATVLTLGSAQAGTSPYDGIVFCKAKIVMPTGNDAEDISVTLPFTTTGTDGKEYTHWNLGEVPAGGVKDSWHDEKGPGKFKAHNSGRVGAHIYLTSEMSSRYSTRWSNEQSGPVRSGDINEGGMSDFEKVFGGANGVVMQPLSSLEDWRLAHGSMGYCLAFTCDMDAKSPTWQLLNRWYDSGDGCAWREDDRNFGCREYIGAYMGYLPAGEYLPFDVKFWAPRDMPNGTVYFTFKVEASSFPLWEHDIEVK